MSQNQNQQQNQQEDNNASSSSSSSNYTLPPGYCKIKREFLVNPALPLQGHQRPPQQQQQEKQEVNSSSENASNGNKKEEGENDQQQNQEQQNQNQNNNNNNDNNNNSEKRTGMNKGKERANATAGTVASERPTFEGEKNFLNHPCVLIAKPLLKKKNEFYGYAGKLWSQKINDLAKAAAAAAGVAAGGVASSNNNTSDSSSASATTAAASSSSNNQNQNQEQEQQQNQQQQQEGEGKAEENQQEEKQEEVPARRTRDGKAGGEQEEAGNKQQPNQNNRDTSRNVVDSTAQLHVSEIERKKKLDDEPVHEKRKRLFENKLSLAPLTTVGNLPFRRICKEFGVDVTYSEVSLCTNLNNLQKSEFSLIRKHESEDIFGIQLAASRGGDMALTCTLLEQFNFEYDILNLNIGCPQSCYCDKGLGFGLAQRPNRLREVVMSMVNFQTRPVEMKLRIGIDAKNPDLHTKIPEYETWGASSLVIHGRSKNQRYTKLSDYAYIQRCSELTSLPVAGNGDVMSFSDAVERKELAPSVNTFMIGRGALIKPWCFTEIKEQRLWDISASERFDMLKKYAKYGLAHWGADERGVASTRRFLCEWQSFLCRYVPVGVLEVAPQKINERPPAFYGRNELETLLASESVADWIKISEMILGPAGDKFSFTPKHKSNSYSAPAASELVQNVAAAVQNASVTGDLSAAVIAGAGGDGALQQENEEETEVEG